MIDFEMFRPILESKLQTSERKSNAERRPIDPVLMFKRIHFLGNKKEEILSTKLAFVFPLICLFLSCYRELNSGPHPYQGCALPLS